MAFTFGFYDSVDHDRVYNAEQFSSVFDGIILDGIFRTCQIEGSINNNDRFSVSLGGGMKVFVGRGRAWFNNTWNYNDTRMGLTLDHSHGVFDRYDAVILEVNNNIDRRENTIKVLTGTPSSTPQKPALTRSNGVYQYALAYIYVPAGITELTVSNIQNVVGTNETPWCRCIADDIEMRTRNDLTTTEAGYMLDARQGKVLNDKKFDKDHVANNLTTTAAGYALDARQGKILNDSYLTKLDKDHVANNLTTTVAGYALDARQGKVISDKYDTVFGSKLDKDHVADNLTTTASGYALNARQGKAINDGLQLKFNKGNVVNNLNTTVAGYALDARQGTALNDNKLDKANVKNDLTGVTPSSEGYALDARWGLNLQAEYDGNIIPFRFGIDARGNYGFKKAGADTVIPFNRLDNTYLVKLGSNISSYNVKTEYPDVYNRLTSDNFFLKINHVRFSGGISGYENLKMIEDTAYAGNTESSGKVEFDPDLSFNPIIEYNSGSGTVFVRNTTKSDTISYDFKAGPWYAQFDRLVVLQGQSTVSVSLDYDLYMVYDTISQ